MARPPRYDTAALVDAALQLAADKGPSAVTMAAVARALGAPSGSVYHRFPRRDALLAALWRHCVEGFQDAFLDALDARGGDPREAVANAARLTVEWGAQHPREALVLLQGPAAFAAEPAVARPARALSDLAERLGLEGAEERERLTVALVDIPYSLLRRHLRDGGRPPPHAAQTAERCARAVLASLGQAQRGSGGTSHESENP